MAKPTPAQMRAAVEAFKKKFTTGFYHGSPSPSIKSFNPAKSKKDFPIQDVTFVSPNPDFASSFAPNKTGATMYPVNVNMGKHFDPNTPEGNEAIKQFLLDKYQKEAGTDYFEEAIKQKHEHLMDKLTDPLNTWKTLESPEMLNYLRSSGHDTFKVVEGGVPNVGIFKPQNIRGKFAKFNPEDAESPDFMKAAGGAVEGYESGGKVGALTKLAKNLHSQNPKVAQALEEYLKGNISQEERIRILNQNLPIRKWSELPPDYTDEQIRNALMTNKQPKALAPVPAGMRVGNRLDIPAYTQKGVYVDTTHDASGSPISYGRTGHLKDVEFSSKPDKAVRVGLGTKPQALTPMAAEYGADKSPFALIKGINVGTKDDEVRRMMAEMLNDPRYVQIGMDPRRGSQFYNKETGMPVFAAEEKFQSGPLVIVPRRGLEETSLDDPRLNLTDFIGKKYAGGGKVGALESLAKKLMPLAEREANKAKFLEPSAVKNRLYHATNADIKAFNPNMDARGNKLMFVSEDPDVAHGIYSMSKGTEGSNIMPVHIQTKNPFDPISTGINPELEDWVRKNKKAIQKDLTNYNNDYGLGMGSGNYFDNGKVNIDKYIQNIKGGDWQAIEASPSLVNAIKNAGHDSIKTFEEGAHTHAVFEPTQIKSAIGNTGTYNPLDPDITKKRGGKIKK